MATGTGNEMVDHQKVSQITNRVLEVFCATGGLI